MVVCRPALTPSRPRCAAAEPLAAAADGEGEGDLVLTAADEAFIDDEGLAPGERVDFADDADLQFDEAEEAAEDMEDELDRMFSKRRRHDTGAEAESRAMVESLLAQMEVAVEEDLQAYESGKPAVNKLRMLKRVEEVLAIKRLHGDLLDSGLLGVLKAWIEPMADGTLPNSKVRGTVLSLLGRLPVDCSYEDRREQLKRSGLGRQVMFLCKLPDETPDNRQMARDLVERWSRPILAPRGPAVDAEEMERILAARQQRERAQRAAEPAAGDEGDAAGDATAAPRPGQPGFRFHAAIPKAAALDYVRQPESKAAMVHRRGGGKGGGEHKLTKKLAGLGKKKSARASNVSVEGRNVTF
jgi:transcription factor SPN1